MSTGFVVTWLVVVTIELVRSLIHRREYLLVGARQVTIRFALPTATTWRVDRDAIEELWLVDQRLLGPSAWLSLQDGSAIPIPVLHVGPRKRRRLASRALARALDVPAVDHDLVPPIDAVRAPLRRNTKRLQTLVLAGLLVAGAIAAGIIWYLGEDQRREAPVATITNTGTVALSADTDYALRPQSLVATIVDAEVVGPQGTPIVLDTTTEEPVTGTGLRRAVAPFSTRDSGDHVISVELQRLPLPSSERGVTVVRIVTERERVALDLAIAVALLAAAAGAALAWARRRHNTPAVPETLPLGVHPVVDP